VAKKPKRNKQDPGRGGQDPGKWRKFERIVRVLAPTLTALAALVAILRG